MPSSPSFICGCHLSPVQVQPSLHRLSLVIKFSDRLLLKKKRKGVHEISESLGRDTGKSVEDARGKAGSQMAQILSKSNALRRACKAKLCELKALEEEITTKGAEHRYM